MTEQQQEQVGGGYIPMDESEAMKLAGMLVERVKLGEIAEDELRVEAEKVGLAVTPTFLDPADGKMRRGFRFRDRELVTRKMPAFDVPSVSVGITFLDPKNCTYRKSCANTPEEEALLRKDVEELMAGLCPKAVEQLCLSLVRRLNETSKSWNKQQAQFNEAEAARKAAEAEGGTA